MCFNEDFEALYTGYRDVIQSLVKSARARKSPTQTPRSSKYFLDANATIADVTNEIVWSKIEELFGLTEGADAQIPDPDEYAGLAELFDGI